MNFLRPKTTEIILIIILIAALFIRIYDLPNYFIFGLDEEYQATLARTLVNDFHPIWIGVNASGTGFYLGPYWTYFTAFWLWISGGDPLITGYVSSLIGVLTVAFLYVVSRELFSKKISLLVSLLYAFLPLIIFFDQKYWNPSPASLLSLILLYSLLKIKTNTKWWIVSAFFYGIMFHSHLSLVPFIVPALFIFVKYRKEIKKSTIVLSAISFIVAIFPLIIFDYYHKFSNILTPIRLLQSGTGAGDSATYLISQNLQGFVNTLGRIWYLMPGYSNHTEVLAACKDFQSKPIIFLSIISLLIIGLFLIKKKTWHTFSSKVLAISMLSLVTAYIFFPGNNAEYYLLGFFPLFFLIIGDFINHLKGLQQKIALLVIGLLLVSGLFTIISTDKKYGIAKKRNLINKVNSKIQDSTFFLQEKGGCHRLEGWRYLFSVYGKTPTSSSIDDVMGWLYPDEISNTNTKVIITVTETGKFPGSKTPQNELLFERDGFSAFMSK